ncbi:unnamed protein product [Spirodela intermedia]|uniref:Protein kinase domain-containing protein n=1 Tax=Spirodela intermedia TaxID=51605 RepID=A0A7I8JDM0_SPIIN|nr:unnamed protein product [Spirodela intermedia]CAA6667472.1 unnamed protein product [Spirodela intermedia]
MGSRRFPTVSFLFLSIVIFFPSSLLGQQPYIGLRTNDCYNPHNASSGLGYFCNGAAAACPAFLTFRPANQSLAAVAALLGVDSSLLAQANSISLAATFPSGSVAVVPVNCSCSGGYYQAEASYVVSTGDTYLTIANNIFQGLSTCQALINQNRSSSQGYLIAGSSIPVPLRCACPTPNQASNGVRYLLSYLLKEGDEVNISIAYGVTREEALAANGLSFRDTIYPFTTLLLPLKNEPRISQETIPPPPPPPEPSAAGGSGSNRTKVYVGVGVSIGTVIILSLGAFFLIHKRKEKNNNKKGSIVTEDSTANPPSVILSLIPNISLKVYEFHQLNQATKGFSTERRIEGSSVYRAELSGSPAAVKRMNRDVSGEINILMKINHFNIISLSGFCSHLGTCYLVYEYMENGSLRDWIIHKDRSKVLPWIQRIKIALDVAIGLDHLHGYTEPPCVHKDVKSSNILLDGDFRAKVANFGLFRPAAGGGEFPPTRHIVGTVGYMAPEYAEHGFISPSIDVYSFGVVMMELVTGRDAAAAAPGGEESFAAALTSFLGGGGGDT